MFSSSIPHSWCSSLTVPCAMNLSGIPIRFIWGVYPLSDMNSNTALPKPPVMHPSSTVMIRLYFGATS